jgi:AcrR family transcriptional regulator
MATVEGIEGLSIGGLASELGMSKSGLYAHFGSKVDLQMATVGEAARIFEETVVAPAMSAPTAHARLLALGELYVQHLRDRVFPGGCFFAGAALEMGSRPGPVRESIADFQRRLTGLFAELVVAAQQDGRLLGEDPRGLAFEINGQFLAASAGFTLTGDPKVLDLADTVLHRRLT